MSTAKVAISIDEDLLAVVDQLVSQNVFANRSQAIQAAVREKVDRLNRHRLAEECAKLDPQVHKALAEEGMSEALDQWPEY